MKNLLTHGRSLVVTALLGCGACALAQSLGNPVSDAWIGQPLEVTVPARFASGDGSDGCVRAEVKYGDTRVPANQVRTTVLGDPQQRRVRVQATAPVNEPLVTLVVHAGCTGTITRTYTLLPDMPSEAVLAAAAAGTGAAKAATATPVPVSAPVASALRVPALTAAPLRSLRAARTLGARGAKSSRHESANAFLRLQPAVPESELRPVLQATTTLSALGDAARSATARLLWQAINADPQDLMRSTANLQRLELELLQLRATAGRTHNEMVALRRSLDHAQPWYASAYTAQVLSLMVLAAAAATMLLAWRERTRRLQPAWFEAAQPAADPTWDPAFATVEPVQAPVLRPLEKRAEPDISMPAPVRTPRAEPAVAAAPRKSAPAETPAPRELPGIDFHPTAAAVQPEAQARRAAAGELRVETLAATFEEIDFLVSMGLEPDAMDVLKAYVEGSASPSPAAYFELMRLCAREDGEAAEAVRRRYLQVFGVEAPRVEQVIAPWGLEANKPLTERVTRAWGASEVLHAIEDALFTPPQPASPLTLQGARELISLYELAMELVHETGLAEPHAQPLAPWAHAEDVHAAAAAAQAAAEAVGGHHFALDVDLNAAPAPLPEPVARSDADEAAARLKAEKEAAREAFARKLAEEEDAFSTAMASERVPVSRY